MPVFKVPFHLSYLIYLAGYSMPLARTYLRMALTLCRMTGTQPSYLLHPLDFLGSDDGVGLEFFPGMQMEAAQKLRLISDVFDIFQKNFRFVPMSEHIRAIRATPEFSAEAQLAASSLGGKVPASE